MHDRSASGGAVFIEPQSVVDANNRLREWEAEEREAVEEIQRDLTTQINEAYPHLKRTQKAAGKLDFAFAKGRLSIRQSGVEAILSESPQTHLLEARHPLIENPVPNEIILGEDFNVLLITGPNTGGKTVVLKTLGLLTLMAACGLHIPAAPKSTLWIPQQVFADIGDEQSLEQSLSTFSAHLKNILRVVQNVKEGDLVLLDEVGAGTDPDEGAALAKAILRNLSRRKALVLASTHFGELKRFAISAQRFENASVEFDERSLRPSYHLRIGVPGSSNALHIARRLGLPAELVDRAKRYLGEQYAISEDATRQLEATGRELRDQQIALEQSRAEAEKTQREYQRKIKQIEREKAQLLAQSQQQMADLIAQTQQESESILHELRKQHKESKETETARGRLKTLREKVQHQLPRKSTFDVAGAKSTFEEEPESAAEKQVRVGELVHVKQFNREGEVLSPPGADGKIEVRIGAMKMRLEPVQLKSLRERKNKSVHINVAAPLAASEEINLVGKTTDEALFLLEKHMDDAILAGLKNVWIIHGRGTGALRTAIRRWLKAHSQYANFEYAPLAEGGDGATVVHLD
jgi:DNA mismatch repair protein MutS2